MAQNQVVATLVLYKALFRFSNTMAVLCGFILLNLVVHVFGTAAIDALYPKVAYHALAKPTEGMSGDSHVTFYFIINTCRKPPLFGGISLINV